MCILHVFRILNRMANIFNDEKFLIGLPFEEEEEEKNHDENIEADFPRE